MVMVGPTRDMTQQDVQQLRETLARRQQEKAELELQVRSLQSAFQEEIVPLQEEVLRLRTKRLKEAAQQHRRSARLRNAYHDAEDAYQAFRERQSETRSEASDGDDIKAVYRRATKHCHPDAVPDAYRSQAAATFQALETAYGEDRRRAVRAIAGALNEWGFPRASSSSPGEETPDGIGSETLRRAVSDLNNSIQQLRGSEAYRVISESADVNVESVIGAQRQALEQRLQELKRQKQPRI